MATESVFRSILAALAAQALVLCATAASHDTAASTNSVVFKEAAPAQQSVPGTKLIPPSVLDVKRAVGKKQEKGITIFTRDAGIDTAAGIGELFQRCRAEDARVAALVPSKLGTQLGKYYTSEKFSNSVGLVHLKGNYFELMGPRKDGKGVPLDAKSRAVLEAAEAAFAASVDALIMQKFIDWSEVPARIYMITSPEAWQLAYAMQSEPRPVQSVVHPRGTREFYVAATAATNDYTMQAIAYVVAATVLDEFAVVASSKPDAKEPLFFATGFAADIAKLEAALTKEGPFQVTSYKVANKTYRIRRCVPGIVPPLKAKRLFPLDTLVALAEYPTGGEDLFHLVRQSAALVAAMRGKGPLATVAMARAMATGSEFRKEIGASYAAIQRDVEGCEVAAPGAASAPKSRFPDYDRFSLMIDPVFHELTEEFITEEAARKAKPAAK